MKIKPNNRKYFIKAKELYLPPGSDYIISNQHFYKVEQNLSLKQAKIQLNWWNNYFRKSTQINADLYYIGYED